MKASKITQLIENQAPLNLAESWDNVGYQIGSRRKDIKKVLLTLDITDKTIQEALDNDIDLIISHHPFFFNKFNRIDLDTYKGEQIEKIIKNNLTIYSAHTNLDKAKEGINEYLAKLLELKNIRPLKEDHQNNGYFKLIVYVPVDSIESIQEILKNYETGKIYDNYKNCTFRTEGKSTFEPIDQANPTIGELNKISEVDEIKIETVIPEKDINRIIQDLKKVHPYEEMAYDLFEIKVDKKASEGLGRIGNIQTEYSPEEFLRFVLDKLDLNSLKEAGRRPKKVKKVAICSGAGSEFIILAKRKKADVLITGDLKYHEGQRAYEEGLWVLDAGHFGTEKQVIKVFEEILEPISKEIEIIPSESSQDYLNLVQFL